VERWIPLTATSNRAALYGPSFVADVDGIDFVQVSTASFDHGEGENHEIVDEWQAGGESDY
jgi:hypothetical protein